MKKLIISVALLALLAVGAFSQVGPDDKSVTYRNIQIYKVYEHPDAYIVMYYEDGLELGQVTIPTEWFASGNVKGDLRTFTYSDFSPYMMLQYVDGTFTKVILNMPNDRNNMSWGVISGTADTEVGSQTDTLILE